jgi:hypothetical protein
MQQKKHTVKLSNASFALINPISLSTPQIYSETIPSSWAQFRADHTCDDVLLFKLLTYSILQLSKTNGTTFDNDAKLCYDRIVMLLVHCKPTLMRHYSGCSGRRTGED